MEIALEMEMVRSASASEVYWRGSLLSSVAGGRDMLQDNSTSFTDEPAGRVIATPGVCGGEPCIAGTRMPIRILATYREQGSTDAELLRDFPYLKSEDLAAAWVFVDNNPDVLTE
jgi:uncharacterized protein (DUF433 family)